MLNVVHGVIRKLLALPQVTVAAVRGVCLGGGLEIASSCDLVVASEDSSFATPEILVGCYPPVALARFAGLIGYHRAAEMILTGRRFSASEAHAVGLINRVFVPEQLESRSHGSVGRTAEQKRRRAETNGPWLARAFAFEFQSSVNALRGNLLQ